MDSRCERVLDTLAEDAKNALQDNFVGFYVHGSLAMTGFNPDKSDIDYIIVCEENPSDDVKKKLLDSAERLWDDAPSKGLEMHVMRLEDCKNPAEEPLFVLHYSAMHRSSFSSDPYKYIGYMHGEDGDLNAHLTVMKSRGICYVGKPIDEVFGEVSAKAYVSALLDDADWSDGDMMYHVLNGARSLAYIRDKKIFSKEEGGVYGISNIPEYKDVIKEALDCYKGKNTMESSKQAEQFCEMAYNELSQFLETLDK